MNHTIRILHCPSCRTDRPSRRVAATHVHGHPMDLVECTARDCELIWAVRPDRPVRPTPLKAAA